MKGAFFYFLFIYDFHFLSHQRNFTVTSNLVSEELRLQFLLCRFFDSFCSKRESELLQYQQAGKQRVIGTDIGARSGRTAQ